MPNRCFGHNKPYMIMSEYGKNQILRKAAYDFTNKASKMDGVLEIAVAGSVAGGDAYPGDLDVSLVAGHLERLAVIAKYARQMSKYYHSWEVFVFDRDLLHLGRICHRKQCPSQSVDCWADGCGDPPHLRVHPGFKYDEKIFFSSPFEILYTSSGESLLLARKKELKITGARQYPVLKDLGIQCMCCGKTFTFPPGEQKWYKQRGFCPPKRCSGCRENNDGSVF